HMDGQVLLGILADGLDQVTAFHQQQVGIVVEGGIAKKFSGAALACFQAIGDVGKFLNRVLQLVGQLFIPEQLARGAVAGIDFIDDLVGFNDGLVGILHEGVILHQQTQVAFAAANVVNNTVKLVNCIHKLVGQLLISQELAHGALTSAHVI